MSAAPVLYSFEDSKKLSEAHRECHVDQAFALIEQKRVSLDELNSNDDVIGALNEATDSTVGACTQIDQKHQNYGEDCNVRVQLYTTKAILLKVLFDFLQLVKNKIGANCVVVISGNQHLKDNLIRILGAI
jgi:hypothetical protein